MLEPYLTAAVLTAGIIIGIGPQNLFILKQGIRGHYIWLVVLICELCEILTISIGAFGAGHFFSQSYLLQKIIGFAGALFLLYYGYKSFRNAFQNHPQIEISRKRVELKDVILTSLSISLLNPWALMDTMVIIGGATSQYETLDAKIFFLLGSLSISSLWFSFVGFSAKSFSRFLNTNKTHMMLEIFAGLIMSLAAAFLFWSVVSI